MINFENQLKNLDKIIEEQEKKKTNAEKAKEEAIKKADEESKKAGEAKTNKEKAEKAKEKVKEAEAACKDIPGVEMTADSDIAENKKNKNNKKDKKNKVVNKGLYENNNNKLIKGIAIGAAAVILLTSGYSLIKESKGKNFKPKDDEKPKTENEIIVDNNENFVLTDAKFDELVTEYMKERPEITESAARTYLSIIYFDKLKEDNPELLFELTGYYEYKELTTEEFNKIVDKATNDLKNFGIELDVEDVEKLIAIINIDQLATDNPELLTELKGEISTSEFVTDAFKVTGSIKNKNYDIYEETGKVDGLFKLSNYVFDMNTKKDLMLIEFYAEEISLAKGDATKQNALVTEFLEEIQMPDGKLSNMEDGIGFASTIAVDGMINYLTFNENVSLLTEENHSALLNHDTLELYLSNIFGNLERCQVKTLTR